MKAIIIQLLKSFLLAKGKIVLCVIASILSAWGIGTIVYSKAMTDRDFEQNFSASNPADIILSIVQPSSQLLQALASNRYVSHIERRETMTGRIQNKKGHWMPLLIFACQDVQRPRVSTFSIRGSLIASSLFIEGNGSGFLDTGKVLTIQLPGYESLTLRYAGRAFDPGLPPSQMEQMVYAYTDLPTMGKMIKGYTQERFLIRLKKPYRDAASIRDIYRSLKILIQQSGHTVSSVVFPPPGEHPHQNIVNGVSFLQKSLGVTLAILGIILLSLVLITWLYPQMVNVGIMKTVGASARMVLYGYMSVLCCIIGIGMLIGLPLGYVTAKAYSRFIDFLQNFAPIDDPLPLSIHSTAIVLTVMMPLLTAAIPLIRVSKTSVYQALNRVFYTSYQSVFRITNRFFKNTRLKYSINNLFRSQQRTGLLLLLLIAGIALFSAGFNLRHSLKMDFKNYIQHSTYEITVILQGSYTKQIPIMRDLPFIQRIAYLNRKGIQFQSDQNAYAQSTTLTSFPPDYVLDPALFVRGKPQPKQTQLLYISQKYAGDFSALPLGHPITITDENGGRESFVFGGVIKNLTSLGFFRYNNAANNQYDELAIQLKPGFDAQQASQSLDAILAKNGIVVRDMTHSDIKLTKLENHLQPTYLIIQVMGILTLVLALSGLLIVLHLSLEERAKEMGIMKAIGSSVQDMIHMYQKEFGILTGISMVIGSLVGYWLNASICQLFGVMVLEVPVPPLLDVPLLLLTIIGVMLLQTVLIAIYIRAKIQQTSVQMIRNL